MFSLLIRRDGLIEPPAMSEIDAHCHILPGIDDGAPDEQTSIAIANLLLELGVKAVVATPHVISDIYPNTTERILESVDKLRKSFEQVELPLEIIPGAEYYVEKEFLNRIAKGDLLAWGRERYVLFESPSEHEPMLLEEIIFNLKCNGYTPLLAHPERYRFLQRHLERIQDLKRLGARFQVNHPSFHLPRISRGGELARLLYVKGYVDQFGTDIHRATLDDRALASRGDKRLFTRLNSR
ncbi:MAG: capsular biosynthesis protein [Proteobacteria bacterium]|nr:capsular biosynthesis protein [Pseudomonadota bacterium]